MVHASLSSFLKTIFTFGSRERSKEIARIQQEDHSYDRGNIDNRGPCPGLNSLANQGYLYVTRLTALKYIGTDSLTCPAMDKTSVLLV